MVLIALSLAQMDLLVQDDQNEVQHDFFGHLVPLALVLVSHNVKGIINGTIAFLRSRWSK